MDDRVTEEMLEEMLRSKIDELDGLDVDSEHALAAANTVDKIVDANVKMQQAKQSKKEWIFNKILVPLGTGLLAAAGMVGAAVIKGVFDHRIAQDQLQFYGEEHERAYDYESTGEVKHLVTSPTTRDILREKPKMR